MPDLSPQELVKEQLGNIALHAMNNQGLNIKTVLANLEACDKAIAGLPNLVDASNELASEYDQGEPVRTLANCVKNLAKTQIGYAKIMKHSLTLNLITCRAPTMRSTQRPSPARAVVTRTRSGVRGRRSWPSPSSRRKVIPTLAPQRPTATRASDDRRRPRIRSPV